MIKLNLKKYIILYIMIVVIDKVVEREGGEGVNSQGPDYFEDPSPILKIFVSRLFLKNFVLLKNIF